MSRPNVLVNMRKIMNDPLASGFASFIGYYGKD